MQFSCSQDQISCPWNDICGNGSPTQSKMNTLTLITLMMFIYSLVFSRPNIDESAQDNLPFEL